MVKQVFSTTFIYITGSGFSQFLSLLFTLVLMQRLSIAEYGQYNLVVSLVAIFAFIMDGGLTSYILKEFNRRKFDFESFSDDRHKFIINVFSYQLVTTAILSLIYILLVFLTVDIEHWKSFLVFGLFTLLLGVFTPVFALLVANGERKIIVIKDISTALLRLFIVLIGFNQGFNVAFIYWTPIAAVLIAFILLIYFLKKWDFKVELFKNDFLGDFSVIFRSVIPFLLLAFVNILYNKIDFFMLNELSTINQVAFYAGATIFVYPFMFISAAASSAILPFYAKREDNNKNNRKDEQKIFAFMLLIGTIVSFSLFLSSDFLYSNLFDGKYQSSSDVYSILVWYLLIVFGYTSVSNSLIASGKIKVLIYMNVLMLILNVILNFILIPNYGAQGAALATVFSEIVIFVFLLSYISNKGTRIA